MVEGEGGLQRKSEKAQRFQESMLRLFRKGSRKIMKGKLRFFSLKLKKQVNSKNLYATVSGQGFWKYVNYIISLTG